MLCISEISF